MFLKKGTAIAKSPIVNPLVKTAAKTSLIKEIAGKVAEVKQIKKDMPVPFLFAASAAKFIKDGGIKRVGGALKTVFKRRKAGAYATVGINGAAKAASPLTQASAYATIGSPLPSWVVPVAIGLVGFILFGKKLFKRRR